VNLERSGDDARLVMSLPMAIQEAGTHEVTRAISTVKDFIMMVRLAFGNAKCRLATSRPPHHISR
jgi:hypothetical protein